MKGTSNRRAIIVMGATMAAVVGVDLVMGTAHPMGALLATVAVLVVSSAALPTRAWLRVRDFCRWIPWALDSKRSKPAATTIPEDPEDAAQRKSYGLDLVEHDARIIIGMPLGHPERLAYNLPNPEEWDEREAEIWPDGEWTGVIEEVRREQGWKQ